MNRYASASLVLAVGVLAGCAPTTKTALDPDVEMILPAPNVVSYVPPPTVAAPLAPAAVVTVPTTTTLVQVQAPANQTLRAGDVTGERVRASTIYANRIDADEVRGIIHQDPNLQIGAPGGNVRMADVVASIIYADQITANSIVADHIYVKDLRRR